MGNCITDPKSDQITVLVVGASGLLGSYIAKHCLQQPNLRVSILVRDRHKNREIVQLVEKAGGRVLIGDIEKPETIVGITKGFHTVISAISSATDPSLFVKPQINLVNEAIRSGVQRFVPSDFGVNYTKFTRAEIAPFVLAKVKLEFDDYIKVQPIKTLHIWNGILVELFLNLSSQGLTYWGADANQKLDFTTYEDTARFTAAAVAQKDLTGDLVYVGNKFSLNELSSIYNRVKGAHITPRRLGSLWELKNHYEDKKRAGDHMGAFLAGLGLILHDQRSTFDKTNNRDFPGIKSTSMEEFFRTHPEFKLA